LEGETVVVTGVVMGMQRWETAQVIMEAGGIAQDAISKTTTMVVIGERPGATKVNKAAELGLKTITEAEFRRLVGR
jgi:DNA ligase (NAD+)